MRRYGLRTASCLLLLILLTSCNGKFGAIIPDYSVYDGISPDGAELVLNHSYSGEAFNGFKSLINKYNEENERGIKVSLTDDLKARSDLRIVHASEAACLLKAGKSIELSPLISHPLWGCGGRGDFYRAVRGQTDYWDFSRKITSIPISIDANILLVNNELLEEAGFSAFPSGWPLMNYLLWKTSSKYGHGGIGLNYDAGSLVSFINGRGGSILRPNRSSYSFNNPVVNNSLRYIRRQVEGSVITGNTGDYLNQCGFAFDGMLTVLTGVNGIKYYNNLISAVNPELDWSAALLPTRRLGSGITVDSRCAVITAADKASRIAAWDLIKWLSSADIQLELSDLTGSFPANFRTVEKILGSQSGRAEISQPEQWIEALELFHNAHMEVLPNFEDYQQVSLWFEETAEGCINGNTIWLETWRLNSRVKQSRRDAENIRQVRDEENTDGI